MPCQRWRFLFLCWGPALFPLISFLETTNAVSSILGLLWIFCDVFPSLVPSNLVLRLFYYSIKTCKRAKIDATHLLDLWTSHKGSDRFDRISKDRGPGSCMCLHVLCLTEKSSLDALFKWNNGVVMGAWWLCVFGGGFEVALWTRTKTRRLSVASSGVA